MNSKAEFNRSRVPRLKVGMEGWKQAQKKEPTSLQEGSVEEEYEASILEKATKRKAAEEETEVKQQKKPKRIKLDKLEGWGENRENENEEDENLPEGWWRTMDKNDNDRVIKDDTRPPKSSNISSLLSPLTIN